MTNTTEERIAAILIGLFWENGSEYDGARGILKAFGRRRDRWAVDAIARLIRLRLWNEGWQSCVGEIVQIVGQAEIKRNAA